MRARAAGLAASVIAAALALTIAGAASAQSAAGNWQVVLAAGDDAEPVFDNATRAVQARLLAAGVPAENIHRLSASAASVGNGAEPATAENVLRRIAQLPTGPGDRCLIFLTSHGERGEGVWLALSNAALHPDELARALNGGCARAPTVVVVSACYSGAFAGGAMARPNRIILTAARRDRPSFGCQAHRDYNFFDECLLGALPASQTWRGLYDRTTRCVGRMEKTLGMRPSEPQAYFGPRAGGIKTGF
jgi:hypothetical protein